MRAEAIGSAAVEGSQGIHVIHVVLSLEVGGLERVVLDLVREGRQLGQRVSVICLERRGDLADLATAAGATVILLGKRSGITPDLVGRIQSTFRHLRPTVVHCHQSGALLYAGPAARRERVPVVVHTEHINNLAKPLTFGRRLRARLLWRIAARSAARFFCVSEDIVAAARGVVPAQKLVVIHNGINVCDFGGTEYRDRLRLELGVPVGAKVIGTLGRLNEVKCQDLLIRAFATIRKTANVHLLLVGDGPRREVLQSLVRELQLTECVHFAGYQPEPQRYLQAMDIFALTSRLEGLPLAILEAWASNLPIVVSRVGGIPKLVDNGRNGILFDSGDQSELEAAITRLLNDPQGADRIARAGLSHVRSCFDSRRMALDYELHYRTLLQEKEKKR